MKRKSESSNRSRKSRPWSLVVLAALAWPALTLGAMDVWQRPSLVAGCHDGWFLLAAFPSKKDPTKTTWAAHEETLHGLAGIWPEIDLADRQRFGRLTAAAFEAWHFPPLSPPIEPTPWQRARALHQRRPALSFPDRAMFRTFANPND